MHIKPAQTTTFPFAYSSLYCTLTRCHVLLVGLEQYKHTLRQTGDRFKMETRTLSLVLPFKLLKYFNNLGTV